MLPPLHLGHQLTISLSSWTVDPPVLIGLAAAAGLYLWETSPKERARYPNAEPVSRWRIASFFGGLLAFAVALLSPLALLADAFLLSAHMVQHLLITIVGPPLMLLGVPAWLWHAIAGGAPRVWRVWRFITRPVIAYVFFNITFMAVHVPAFYNLALRNENVHILEHLLVWIPAFPAWWCVVAPSRELGALSPPLKALYLFVSTIPGQVVGALITFSGSILYDEYSHANRVWGLSPKVDQEIGGLIMWVGVGVFYLAVALVILFRWAAANEAKERGYGQPASGPALR